MMEFQKIAVFGFGKEGVAVANYLGDSNKITIIDDREKKEIDDSFFTKLKIKNAKFHFGKTLSFNERFNLVIRSPGVRPDHPKIKDLLGHGAVLTTPTNIFFENCPAKSVIGVTGTKGKGTTSSLIYEILKRDGKDTYIAGNIGIPHLEILPKLNKKSFVILELSSFQLIDLKYSPHITVVLMIKSEHLDWHKDKGEYLEAKKSIVKYQTFQDFAIVNQDFEKSRELSTLTKAKTYFFSTTSKTNGVYLEGSKIISSFNNNEEIINVSDILLPGKHNLQNICAAIATAKILKIKNENIKNVVSTFKGLKHRLQFVKDVKGVKYYNDSYSTIPETTIAAIEAFVSPKILILGGSSKKSDFSDLCKKIVKDKSIKAILLVGLEARRIRSSLAKAGDFEGKIVENLKNMREIVKTASQIAKNSEVVILSPACASFGMFKDYEDRGNQFIKEVENLKK